LLKLYIALYTESESALRRSGVTRVNKGSHGFTIRKCCVLSYIGHTLLAFV